ncbi:carboxymuconolactone decarboxylase family protein [Acidiphilium sp. PA]|uniref:carboxymuconolactone decarboxylase family protein n=1 Tax=Acidiphilium sp. PA TaxID=2871705 RepID=UPI002242F512|nr:carboxymuconolactone decarboxylase family protein [Acidiphilium sp. PA]MCW8305513.1 carboxymuconolactone decarboxylase family protein [Acidiphilium sp. PA]
MSPHPPGKIFGEATGPQRLGLPDPARMSEAQRAAHDAIAAGPRGKVEGPLAVWLHSAELANRAQALGEYCRFGSSLPPRLSELAILVMGAFWQAGFEWHVHAPIAEAAGIAPAIIAAVKAGDQPIFTEPDAQAVHDFARELLHTRAISDETYAIARHAIGDRGVVDLVGVLGYYGLISMTIKAFRVGIPE